jgi:hypothetical protein
VILNRILLFGAALMVGLVAGALSHSALIASSTAGIAALAIAATL